MRRLLLLLASLTLPGLSVVAHATIITAGGYTLNNAFVDGYSVTGTVAVNSSGSISSSNLIFNDSAFDDPGLPTFNQVSSTNTYNGLSQNYLTSSNGSGQLTLYFNTTADANGSFDLCLGSAQCGTSSGTTGASALQIYGFYNNSTNTSNPGLSNTNLISGFLTRSNAAVVAAPTPEPSTFALFGTGLIGIAGISRYRTRLS